MFWILLKVAVNLADKFISHSNHGWSQVPMEQQCVCVWNAHSRCCCYWSLNLRPDPFLWPIHAVNFIGFCFLTYHTLPSDPLDPTYPVDTTSRQWLTIMWPVTQAKRTQIVVCFHKTKGGSLEECSNVCLSVNSNDWGEEGEISELSLVAYCACTMASWSNCW